MPRGRREAGRDTLEGQEYLFKPPIKVVSHFTYHFFLFTSTREFNISLRKCRMGVEVARMDAAEGVTRLTEPPGGWSRP